MSWTCVTNDSPQVYRCDFTWTFWILDIFRPMEGNQRHSWIVDSTPSITDPRYWIPAFVSGSWILNPVVSGILDSLGCIPDSKTLDSRIYEQKLSGFRNPDSLTWSDILRSVPHCRTNYVSLRLRFYHSSINITSVNTLICPSLTLVTRYPSCAVQYRI